MRHYLCLESLLYWVIPYQHVPMMKLFVLVELLGLHNSSIQPGLPPTFATFCLVSSFISYYWLFCASPDLKFGLQAKSQSVSRDVTNAVVKSKFRHCLAGEF